MAGTGWEKLDLEKASVGPIRHALGEMEVGMLGVKGPTVNMAGRTSPSYSSSQKLCHQSRVRIVDVSFLGGRASDCQLHE